MCKSCEALSINGINCHEIGCPDSWMDYKRECKECGCKFKPEKKGQIFCSQCCAASYSGFSCDCESCQSLYRETDYSGEDNDSFLLEETNDDSEFGNSDKYYDTHCQNCEELFGDCTCTEEDFE